MAAASLDSSDGSTVWFVDATPHENEEYPTFTPSSGDLGGGTVNIGRVYSDATGDAAGRHDLLTAAKQQIGHALGVVNGFPPNLLPVPTLMITAPRPRDQAAFTSAVVTAPQSKGVSSLSANTRS